MADNLGSAYVILDDDDAVVVCEEVSDKLSEVGTELADKNLDEAKRLMQEVTEGVAALNEYFRNREEDEDEEE